MMESEVFDMSNKQYDTIKLLALLAAPILTLISAVVSIWGIPYGEQITATLAAIDAFIGAVVVIAKANYKGEEEGEDNG